MADKGDWITRDEAIKLSGLNARTFARRDKDGKCGDKETRDGRVYYDPDVIGELADDEEGGTTDTDREIAALVRQLKEALKISLAHNEKLITSIVGPAQIVNKHYVDLIATLTGQNKEYQDRWYTSLELVENVLGMQHERARERLKDERDDKLKRDAFELLKQNVPRAWAMLGRGAKMRELFESFSTEQIQVLLEDENITTPAQKSVLKEIIALYQQDAKQKSEEKKETSTNEQSGKQGGQAEAGPKESAEPGSSSAVG
jgi:hypothetical protein